MKISCVEPKFSVEGITKAVPNFPSGKLLEQLTKKPDNKPQNLCHETPEQERSQRDLFTERVELIHAPAYLLELGSAGH